MPVLIEVAVGDTVRLRKVHPCGSFIWVVTRIGADIGLKCQGCAHRVMLTRREFNKSVKVVLSHTDSGAGSTKDGLNVQPG
ncbi:MAG: DUF951 domain-containing protein [Anaerolineae bacterium]